MVHRKRTNKQSFLEDRCCSIKGSPMNTASQQRDEPVVPLSSKLPVAGNVHTEATGPPFLSAA